MRAAAVLVAGLALAVPAAGQQLPGSLDPNRLEQRFERPAVPESKPPVEFPAPEQAPPPDKAGSIRFELRGVTLEGGTVYPEAEIAELYRPLLGREVSLLDLYRVRDAITKKYRNDGYILSQALIPAQRIAGGVVRIVLVEGRINRIDFQGDTRDRFGLLDQYARRIKASMPLHISVLERYTLLMDDLPGITARTLLEPSKGDDRGSDLTVILEHKPVGITLNLDNRGTRSSGPYQIDGGVDLNHLAGQFEQTSVRGIITPQIDELRYLDLSHTEQVGLDGTTVTLGARRSWSEPGWTMRPFEIKSQSSTLRLGLAYPLIRSRSETLRLTAGVTYRNSRTNSLGDKLSDDRIRFASAGASYDISDGWQGSNLLQLEVNRGFDVLNATDGDKPGQTREGARSNYTKITFSAQRIQPLPEGFGLLVAAEGQFSPHLLVAGEEYGVGGKLYGRAFDSSEITGDKGGSAKIELQYTPDIDLGPVRTVQVFTYADYGRAWTYDSTDQPARQSLATVGAGVRFGLTDTVSGTVEFGKPFIRNATATGNRDPRVFFALSARY